MGLVVLALIFLPRTYTSNARLFVRLGKESVGLDPTATISKTVDVDGSREHEINSEIEILRSRLLLEEVVNKLGPQYVISGTEGATAESSWFDLVLAPVDIARTWMHGDISPTEHAVTELSKTISITSPKKSNIIIVKAQGRDPKHAQRLLQTFVDAYMVSHAKANRTEGSYEFFVGQSKLLADQLKDANAELRDEKNALGLVSLEGQQQNVQDHASKIEAALLENERALAHSEAKIAALKESLTRLPAELDAEQTVLPNTGADAMRNELYKLQIQEKEASSRFTALHPHVIALRRQVADTQRILDEQESSRHQTTKKLSTVHLAAQTELTTAEALASAQRAEGKSLRDQLKSIQSKIKTLNGSEARIADLSRQVDLLETNYRDYVANREQARIDQALSSDRISNVNIIQPASFVAKPSSPRILLSLIAGFVLAAGGSVMLAFVCEHFDPSLKTTDQIENELGIPVLFAVPRSERHALPQN